MIEKNNESIPTEQEAEKMPTFEEFKKLQHELWEALRQREAAQFSIKESFGITGNVSLKAKTEGWEDFPEFRDLREEEQELMASGVLDKQTYQRIYERALGRLEKLDEKIDSYRRNPLMAKAAGYVFRKFRKPYDGGGTVTKNLGYDEFSDEELREIYDAAVRGVEEDRKRHEAMKLSEMEAMWGVCRMVGRAKAMMNARAEWEWAQNQLADEGYKTPEDLLAVAVKKLSEIRKNVGEEKFDKLKGKFHRDIRELSIYEYELD